MERYDMIFLIIIGCLIAWQISVMIRARRNIKLAASAPGRIGGAILCGVILVVAIWRRGNIATAWPIYLGIAVMMALYLVGSVGLTESGFYSTSRYIPFSSLVYFAVDMPDQPVCRLRLARSGGRETIMNIRQEQKGQVEAWLINAGVSTFEAYSENVRQNRK